MQEFVPLEGAMGLGPYINSPSYFQKVWDWTSSQPGFALEWVQIHADKLVKYGPLMTPSVAIIAGCIALYAVHVQTTVARRRAAIDLFLKTEMDQSLLTLYSSFEKTVKPLNDAITPLTKIGDLMSMDGYGDIRGYLNIHELIAVGIKTQVFDEKVCYHYWSAVLVGQCKAADKIIAVMRKEPEDAAAYLEVLQLSKKWDKKIARWRRGQGLPILAALSLTMAVAANADELPTNLLLKCEGKLTTIITGDGVTPDVHHDRFAITLRLRNGELADTDSMYLTTKGCQLKNGTVHCVGREIYPSTISAGSERREMNAYITRETGEYNFFMETQSFTGRNASGRKTVGMKYQRTGICKQASSPIF